MGRLHEDNFRSLRSNIAVLDVEGNPIDCSCDTLWLRAWLQEAKSLSGPVRGQFLKKIKKLNLFSF